MIVLLVVMVGSTEGFSLLGGAALTGVKEGDIVGTKLGLSGEVKSLS